MELLSNSLAYWLNWRVFLCSLLLLTTLTMASYVIRKYEGANEQTSRNEEEEDAEDDTGVLLEHELWNTCWRQVHPIYLMGYRVFAFVLLLLIMILNIAVYGWTIFYFYSEWTHMFLTILFALGSYISINGCHHEVVREGSEEGRTRPHKIAGFGGYVFQIMFQILAGAVVLADCVYYLLNAPYLGTKSNLIFYCLGIVRHSINILLLLGDVLLNSMRFPFFRIAYFAIWTCVFVLSHWIVHAYIPMWWPNTILNLSHSLAPLWYFLMILLHVPSYGLFFLLIKAKRFLLKTFQRDG